MSKQGLELVQLACFLRSPECCCSSWRCLLRAAPRRVRRWISICPATCCSENSGGVSQYCLKLFLVLQWPAVVLSLPWLAPQVLLLAWISVFLLNSPEVRVSGFPGHCPLGYTTEPSRVTIRLNCWRRRRRATAEFKSSAMTVRPKRIELPGGSALHILPGHLLFPTLPAF